MQTNNFNSAYFRILSIDGGGLRGALPAAFLAYIEDNLARAPIRRYFDLIVGTSTGGIIACALSRDIPAKNIQELYQDKGSKIFEKQSWWKAPGWISNSYSNKGLISELQRVLGVETLLGQAKCRLCIPAIDGVLGKTVVFKTRHSPNFIDDHRMPMWKVAAATSAAPIFFPPFNDEQRRLLIDGGLWANNPALVGVAEAVNLGHQLDKIAILSLGTGKALCQLNLGESFFGGVFSWKPKLVDLAFNVQAQGVHQSLRCLKLGSYQRIEAELSHEESSMDDATKVSNYVAKGNQLAKENVANLMKTFFTDITDQFTPIP